jgi:hypothetical protein
METLISVRSLYRISRLPSLRADGSAEGGINADATKVRRLLRLVALSSVLAVVGSASAQTNQPRR